ncbi:hypothetical protein KM043_017163 [Ampulex compressa]|nr:hypothetical protein KM043_017163 [Ampulex compressa]
MRLLWILYIFAGIKYTSSECFDFIRGRIKNGNLGLLRSYIKTNLPKENWFTQRLNHFDPSNSSMWQQRYFSSSKFYKNGGPVFLMIGAEGAISPRWLTGGQWIEFAKRFGAMCFYIEHRYYGKSHPTPDLNTNNLIYLNSQQALGDIAYFIENMNHIHNIQTGTKWIMFGGSYAGSLAAWMRATYPHIVHGAISSSGPVLAQMNNKYYFAVVVRALRKHSTACIEAVAEAYKELFILLSNAIGRRDITKKFNLCTLLHPDRTSHFDIYNLFGGLAGYIATIVQTNNEDRDNSAIANLNIQKFCKIMTDENLGIPIARLAHVNNLVLNATKKNCIDYRYESLINYYNKTDWLSEEAEGGRQWMYQTCTEFGFYQTSSAVTEIFGNTFPIEYYTQQCTDLFGARYNMQLLQSGVEHTNMFNGGLNIKVTNVAFVHGSHDPWHVLGITNSSNPRAPSIYIEGNGHCADMYPPSVTDTPAMKAARSFNNTISKLILLFSNAIPRFNILL